MTKLRILQAKDMVSVLEFLYTSPQQYHLVAVPFISEKEWFGCKSHSNMCIQRGKCLCYRSLYKERPFCITLLPHDIKESIQRAKETNNLLLCKNMLINLEKKSIQYCEVFQDLQ